VLLRPVLHKEMVKNGENMSNEQKNEAGLVQEPNTKQDPGTKGDPTADLIQVPADEMFDDDNADEFQEPNTK